MSFSCLLYFLLLSSASMQGWWIYENSEREPVVPTLPSFVCPLPNGDFALPGGLCGSSYFWCSSGIPSLEHCNRGELFDVNVAQFRLIALVKGCTFDCNNRSNVMYPEGCSNYNWLCWNNKGSKHGCPDDLFFDPDNGQCTYRREIVVCGGSPTTSTLSSPPATTEKLDIDCSCLENGDYGYPSGGCFGYYFTCSHGQGCYKRDCPNELKWDDDNNVCGRRTEIRACGRTSTTKRPPLTGISNPPTQKPPVFICPRLQGDFADPAQWCTSYYYWCRNGQPQLVRCESDKIFSPTLSLCALARFSPDCRSSNPPVPPTTKPPGFVCPQLQGDFPDPEQQCTNYYYWCRSGRARLVSCNAGSIFSPSRLTCVDSTNVPECGITTTQGSPPKFVCPEPTGDFPHPARACTKYFFWCINNVATLTTCADDKIYSSVSRQCQSPFTVRECFVSEPTSPPTTRPSTTESTTVATRPPSSFSPPPGFICPDGGDFPDPSRPCTKYFYSCNNNVAILSECPDDKIYSIINQECSPESTVTECAIPSNPPPTGFICPAPIGHFADPARPCTKYFNWCADNIPIVTECIDGKIYSSVGGQCQEPSTVSECTVVPRNPPPAFVCPSPVGDFPDPARPCTKFFYWCDNNVATLTECLDGKIYSVVNQECLASSAVNECIVPSNPPPTEFVCPSPIGDFADPARPCTRYFYWCANSVPIITECIDGNIYSRLGGRCQEPSTVTECSAFPPVFVCSERSGDFPDPTRPCTKYFYLCDNFVATLTECLDGDIYSVASQECLPPAEVQCLISTVPNNPTPVPIGFVCPTSTGDYPDPARPCTKYFYWCDNNRATLSECLDDKIYSVASRECLHPSAVQCAVTSYPTPVPSVFVCPSASGDLSDLSRPCSKFFYRCSNNEAILTECLDVKIYSRLNRECLPVPEVKECVGSIDNGIRTQRNLISVGTTPKDEDDFCGGRGNGFFATDDCDPWFIKCENNKSTLLLCEPEGTVFDVDRKRCDFPGNVPRCGGVETSSIATKPTTPAEPSTTEEPGFCISLPNGDYPTGKCQSLYIRCKKEYERRLLCVGDLRFDHDSRVCEPTEFIPSCPAVTKPTPAEPSTESTTVTTICEEGEKVAIGQCIEEYIECVGGVYERKLCQNTVFDPVSLGCLPTKVVSGCSESFTTPSNPSTPDFTLCATNGKFPLAPCNEKFIYCFNGVPIRKWCPQGTIFDSSTGSCQSPTLVPGCGTPSNPPPSACQGYEKVPIGPCSEEFNQCDNGIIFRKWCTQGTIFDPATLSCQPASLVNGCGLAPSNPPACQGYEKIPIGPCSEEYNQCDNGVIFRKWCTQGTIFDPATLSCQPTSLVNGCGHVPSNPPACQGYDKIPIAPCSEEYNQCDNGVIYHKWCTEGTIFDPATLSCQPTSLVVECGPVPFNPPACQGFEKIPIGPCREEYNQCDNTAIYCKWCTEVLDYNNRPNGMYPERLLDMVIYFALCGRRYSFLKIIPILFYQISFVSAVQTTFAIFMTSAYFTFFILLAIIVLFVLNCIKKKKKPQPEEIPLQQPNKPKQKMTTKEATKFKEKTEILSQPKQKLTTNEPTKLKEKTEILSQPKQKLTTNEPTKLKEKTEILSQPKQKLTTNEPTKLKEKTEILSQPKQKLTTNEPTKLKEKTEILSQPKQKLTTNEPTKFKEKTEIVSQPKQKLTTNEPTKLKVTAEIHSQPKPISAKSQCPSTTDFDDKATSTTQLSQPSTSHVSFDDQIIVVDSDDKKTPTPMSTQLQHDRFFIMDEDQMQRNYQVQKNFRKLEEGKLHPTDIDDEEEDKAEKRTEGEDKSDSDSSTQGW